MCVCLNITFEYLPYNCTMAMGGAWEGELISS